MGFAVVCFLGVLVWAGMEWWELKSTYSVDGASAYRAISRTAGPGSGGQTWGLGLSPTSVPQMGGAGASGAAPLPTLDVMLQGAAGAGGVPPGKTPNISSGFDDLNKAIEGK
jgi:hypothetical protein